MQQLKSSDLLAKITLRHQARITLYNILIFRSQIYCHFASHPLTLLYTSVKHTIHLHTIVASEKGTSETKCSPEHYTQSIDPMATAIQFLWSRHNIASATGLMPVEISCNAPRSLAETRYIGIMS